MAIVNDGGAKSDRDRPKRAESRKILRAKARLLVRFGVRELDRSAVTKNVSASGLFVHTNHPYRPNTTVQISVQFPERTFHFWGRVIWAKQVPPQLAHVLDCGMGICFIEPSVEWIEFYSEWKRKYGLS